MRKLAATASDADADADEDADVNADEDGRTVAKEDGGTGEVDLGGAVSNYELSRSSCADSGTAEPVVSDRQSENDGAARPGAFEVDGTFHDDTEDALRPSMAVYAVTHSQAARLGLRSFDAAIAVNVEEERDVIAAQAREEMLASAVTAEAIVVKDKICSPKCPAPPRTSKNIMLLLAGLALIGTIVGLSVGLSKRGDNTTVGASTYDEGAYVPSSTFMTVIERGVLRCAMPGDSFTGFSTFDENSEEAEGFFVDLCRALAAAALGNSDCVELIPLTAKQRFPSLAPGEVDILLRGDTHTFHCLERR